MPSSTPLRKDFRYFHNLQHDEQEQILNYERQGGFCADCGQHFDLLQMEADHITPWHAGDRTVAENCQMLCRECDRRKSGK